MRYNRFPTVYSLSPVIHCVIGTAVLLLLFGLLSTSVSAADWQGREVTKDGVLHVMNPANPIEDPTTIKLEKQWRIGGDEEEFLFGVLTQVTSDDEGNIYVLDAQLNQVLIFSADGEYIRSIGREGEGPGEFNRPSDLFLTPDGRVAVMQGMPGKIVLLTPEGEPAGNHPVPEPEDGGMQMFVGGQYAGDRIVLYAERFSRRETGIGIVSSLIAVDEGGNKTVTYYSQGDTRDFASMNFDEKKLRFSALNWSASRDGRVYFSDDFDAYRIQVVLPDGTIERVIEREYESRIRSKEEMERATPQIRIRRGNQAQSPEVKMSKTDRDIQRIYPREDGTLWVLSSRGAFDAPDGAIATFDVYDGDGKFRQQVTLEGDGSYMSDGFHFIKDRFYVVTGLRSARRAMFGVGSEDSGDEEEDSEPMSVICYDLSPLLHSKK